MPDKKEPLPSCQCCDSESKNVETAAEEKACCDDECVEIAAERECDAESLDNESNESLIDTEKCNTGCCSNKPRPAPAKIARNERLQAARERYALTLEAVGCICKALLARNLESCCAPSIKRPKGCARLSSMSSKDSIRSKKSTRSTKGNCCSSSPSKEPFPNEVKTESLEQKSGCCAPTLSKVPKTTGFCSKEPASEKGTASPKTKSGCCSTDSTSCEETELDPTPKNEKSPKDCCSSSIQRQVATSSASGPATCASSCCDSTRLSNIDSDLEPAVKTQEGQSCSATESKAGELSVRKRASCPKISFCCSVASKPKATCCGSEAQNRGANVERSDCCSEKQEEVNQDSNACCSTRLATPNIISPQQVESCAASCCDSGRAAKPLNIKTCCSSSNGKSTKGGVRKAEIKSSDPCCSSRDSDEKIEGITEVTRDIEKDDLIAERVTLSVEGMTCVGCENKLFRTLNAIHGIHNLQTSLVMAQAEFDVDSEAGSIDTIIRDIAKSTGFTCLRLRREGQTVDLLVPGDARDFINRKLPTGVSALTPIDKTTVRVAYDPKVVGARDILKSFDEEVDLAPVRPHSELESGSKHVRQTAFMTLFSALLTIPVLVLAWAPLKKRDTLYGSISLALATIVQVVVAGPFYPSAFKALLFTRVIEMDLLIVLSTSAAYIFSVIAFAYQVQGYPLSTGEFFETSTLLVTLIMVGRLVSAFARQKAVESISVRSLQTNTVLIVGQHGDVDQEIDARLLQYGDIFKVLPDCRIATDGIVVSGESDVDESHITGEAVPVEKVSGSNIIAGCLNGSGTLVIRVRRLPGENTISEIATMVDAAKFSKPKIQQLADKVASVFVPVVVCFTLITFVIWIAVGMTIRHQSASTAVVEAMTYAISVLIVSCPCAIGLAVPMVVVIAGGVGARHGVIFKSAETIELARKITHVVFDKTGTLTEGKLNICEEVYLSEDMDLSASLAFGITSNSKHPVSIAVASYLDASGARKAIVENVKSVAGSGIECTWNNSNIRAGNSRWLGTEADPTVATLLSRGYTVFCILLDGKLIAVYALNDSLRPDSKETITKLQTRNIVVSIVSGDDDGAVQRIGTELAIPPTQIKSRCSPGDKQKYIEALMDQKTNVVLFCGDGTNDAVALAQAHIGLHMNTGTDVAQSAADAVLIRPAISGVIFLIDLSQAAFRRIMFNFTWSFVYNTIAVLLAAGAFVNARIPPEYAGLGELVSVLPVILIALQLRWFK